MGTSPVPAHPEILGGDFADVVLTPAKGERGGAEFARDLVQHPRVVAPGVLSRSGRVGIRSWERSRVPPRARSFHPRGAESHRGHVAADLIALRRGSLVVRRGPRGVLAGPPEARPAPPRADAEAEPGLGSRDDVDVDGGLGGGGWSGSCLWRLTGRGFSGGRPPKATLAGLARLGPRARGDDHGRGVVPPLRPPREGWPAGGVSSWSFGSSSTRPEGRLPGRGRVRGPRGSLPSRFSSRRRSRGRRPRGGITDGLVLPSRVPGRRGPGSSSRLRERPLAAYPGRPRIGDGASVPVVRVKVSPGRASQGRSRRSRQPCDARTATA